jgi:glycerol-3-phosphate dehydrogenase subunit B
MNFDCVVIGAGLAGMTAGVRLAESGASVAVIAKGVGSLHLGGATIDVLGYAPEPVDSPATALGEFIAAHPEHPYARIGINAVSESIVWVKDHLNEIGFTGDLGTNFRLPTAVGTLKPTAVVPLSMASGDVRRGGSFLIIGLESLKDFYPAYCADNLSAAHISNGASVRARGVSIADPVGQEADVSPLGFARQLENPTLRQAFIGTIRSHLVSGESVGVPAVLGVDDAATVLGALRDGLETDVFEIPTLPPSVPGIRAFRKLRSLLRSAGGRLVVGPEAIGAEVDGSRVTAVNVDTSTRVVKYYARDFLLASGGVAAGGVSMDSDWRFTEAVFGFPVALAPEPGEERFLPEYFGQQPSARAGVAIDESLRPTDSRGEPVYDNVRVAGATIAGAEPWREKSGNGIALATGFTAAGEILESANGSG